MGKSNCMILDLIKNEKIVTDLERVAREIEVLKLVCKGVTTEKIAAMLKVSVHTVTFHRVNISKKTNIKNVAQLTRFALKNKLI